MELWRNSVVTVTTRALFAFGGRAAKGPYDAHPVSTRPPRQTKTVAISRLIAAGYCIGESDSAKPAGIQDKKKRGTKKNVSGVTKRLVLLQAGLVGESQSPDTLG